MKMIAIDIGSSFIKGAVLDLDAGAFAQVRRAPFPAPIGGLPALRFEIDPAAVLAATRALLGELAAAAPGCAGVLFCSQMHCLVLADTQGRALSNVLSWRDQRALEPHPSGEGTVFEQLAHRVAPEDRQRLGNELRPGLPLAGLFWHAEHGLLPSGATALALPDFVIAQLCGAEPVSEPTIAAAQGALDLRAGDWHWPLLESLGLANLRWPAVRPFGQPAGELRLGGRQVPCYPAIGDMQCALLGAALAPGELSLNIATGSQASLLRPELRFGDYQARPFFGGAWLNTITHIPAGRALDMLVALLCELPSAEELRVADPWGTIARAVAATPATDLRADLAFFASALGDRGALTNLHEGNLTVGHLFRAAFERMAEAYALCAARLDPAGGWERLVFSGGLAQNLPDLRDTIARRFGAPYRLCDTSEDTLLGLLRLGRMIASR